MNSTHVQVLQCGAMTSCFGLEVLKYERQCPLGYAGNSAFETTVLMEVVWLRSEGVLPRGVHLACQDAREMIKRARSEDPVDLPELRHRYGMLLSSGSLLPTPCHELFWVGFAIGGYATWPTEFDTMGEADPWSLAHLKSAALCERHISAVCDHGDIDVAAVEGLKEFLGKPEDEGECGMKELARKCYEQLSCCISRR